jgi:asparagine synthetase B (glutamine-hydrolysing)
MSGIVGILNLNQKPLNVEELKRMIKVIKNRGPEGECFFYRWKYWFGELLSCNSLFAQRSAQKRNNFKRAKNFMDCL